MRLLTGALQVSRADQQMEPVSDLFGPVCEFGQQGIATCSADGSIELGDQIVVKNKRVQRRNTIGARVSWIGPWARRV